MQKRPFDDAPAITGDGGDPVDREATDLRLPVAEERVVVTKETVERSAGIVRLRTRSTDVPVSETLASETVDIERVPVDRIVADPPETRVEGDVTIIPVVEEVFVRQYLIVEEVRITSRTETRNWTDTVTLRRQEVEIDLTDDDGTADDPVT